MASLEQRGDARWFVEGDHALRLNEFTSPRARTADSVFILASGPSATDFPLERYGEHPVLAMNGSIRRCVDAGISPLFYLCDDASFVRDRPEMVRQGVQAARNAALGLECYSELLKFDRQSLEGVSPYLLERVNRFPGQKPLSDRKYAWSIRRDQELLSGFSLLRKKTNRIGFSLNMRKGYFVARTIPYVALQLAFHLGFKRAFIVGMDLQNSGTRFYETGAAALPSTIDIDYDDYILPSFRFMAHHAVPATGVEVYNLSRDSRLPSEVVPKITLLELDRLLGS